ncbi:MAG TPA: phage portal protein [Buttiauxella sp.]
MSLLDEVVGLISPGWKAARLRSRLQVRAYEAALPSRTHRAKRENRSANQLTDLAGRSLREQARWLDNNHDLVIGILDKLEERIVGARGISVEPHPLTKTGELHADFARQIQTAWAAWSVSPDVTGQFTRPVLERLMARSWLRDGEVFGQLVSGAVAGLVPVEGIPFWIEALEADYVPLSATDQGSSLQQGIYLNDWGRAVKYQVYKHRPVQGITPGDTKEVSAASMLHLKFMRRLHQVRGHSLLSGVIIRLAALGEYENSELTAARIAASLGLYIKKGDPATYNASDADDNREIDFQPGMIWDGLEAGEDIDTIKSDRPNPNLESFRNGQLRAVSAGTRGSFSSIARNYDGTYSAQRQELVEAYEGYSILQDAFIAAVSRPVYRAWLAAAIAAGVLKPPADLDRHSLYNAVFRGPVMPWIDPLKEANSWRVLIRGGAATESDWVQARGASPNEVKRRRKAEIDENHELGLVFDTDPANDKGVASVETTKPDEPPAKSERKKQ